MLMTESAESNLLTLVEPWSTRVITSKTSPTNPNDPLDQVNTHFWSTLGQRHGQTPLKPWCLWTSSVTFAAFSKFHLSTPKSPNIKLSSFSRDTTFMMDGISNFEWRRMENVVNCQQPLFTGIGWHSKFGSCLCKIRWEKHHRAFLKVVEGSELYDFAFLLRSAL
jgi:hypothetical protein